MQLATGLSDSPERGNAHIPSTAEGSLAKTLFPAQLLPLAFFSRVSADTAQWSLPTLLAWISIQHPYIHAESSTVCGGPTGVRNVLFGLSRVLQNISIIQSGADLPDSIRRIVRGDEATWSATRALAVVRDCILVLQRQMTKSMTILQVTFAERSAAWEATIHEQYRAWQQAGEPVVVAPLTRGVDATSGIPSSMEAVCGIYRRLEALAAEQQDPDETVEASRIMRRSNAVAGPTGLSAETEPDGNEESEAEPDSPQGLSRPARDTVGVGRHSSVSTPPD